MLLIRKRNGPFNFVIFPIAFPYSVAFSSQEAMQKYGRIQNMDPRSMDHLCGPGPWTTPNFLAEFY